MAAHPSHYRWSSYRANAEGLPDPLITPHPLIHGLADDPQDRRAAYRELFSADLDASQVARRLTVGASRSKTGASKPPLAETVVCPLFP